MDLKNKGELHWFGSILGTAVSVSKKAESIVSAKVLITGKLFPPEILKMLPEDWEFTLREEISGENKLREFLREADAYIFGGEERIDEGTAEGAVKLKAIAFIGVQPETFFEGKALEILTKRGIPVTLAIEANTQAVAEMTVALILERAKHLSYLAEEVRASRWQQMTALELRGKTLAIIGFGRIGRRVADIMHLGFGMKVVVFTFSRKPEALRLMRNLEGRFLDLESALREADVVCLHPALSDKTRGMIGERELNLMKSGSILINAARAELVQPLPLYEVLESGKISAAFDGYWQEPADPQNDPYGFLKLPSSAFLLTPHQGFNTRESNARAFEAAVESIRKVLGGMEYPYVANPDYKQYR